MSDRYQFEIDGVAIPAPSSYKFGAEDLSSKKSGRTLDGVMHKDVVSVKDYYTCKWKKLSWEEAASLLSLVNGKQRVMLTYLDPRYPLQILQNYHYLQDV